MKRNGKRSQRILAFVTALFLALTSTGETFGVLAEVATPTDLVVAEPEKESEEAAATEAPAATEAAEEPTEAPEVTEPAEEEATEAPEATEPAEEEATEAPEATEPAEEPTEAPAEEVTAEATAEPTATPAAIDYSKSLAENEAFEEGFAVVHGNADVLDGDNQQIAAAQSGFVVYVGNVNRLTGKASVSYVLGESVTGAYMRAKNLYPMTEDAVAERIAAAKASAEKGETVYYLGGNENKPLDVMPEAWLCEEAAEAPAEEEQAGETAAPEETPAAEEPAAESTEEPTEEPAEEATEEPAAEPTEEAVEEPTEEPVEEPTEEPVRDVTITDKEVTVTITSDALPEGVALENVSVKAVPMELSDETLSQLAGEGKTVSAYTAYDITLTDTATGNEFEPVAPITVVLPMPAADEADVAVAHIQDDDTITEVSDFETDGDSAEFAADSFSGYVVFVRADAVSMTASVIFSTHKHNNGEDVARVPEQVSLTLQYSADNGATWESAGDPVTVTIEEITIEGTEDKEYKGTAVWANIPTAASGDAYTYKITESGMDDTYWYAAITSPVADDAGNYTATVKNCPPLSVQYDIAWYSSADSQKHYEEREIDGETENKLIIHSTNSHTNSVSLQIHMNILGDSERSFAEGTVHFTVPVKAFTDRDGNKCGTLSWQIPQYPNKNDQSTFSYTVDSDGNYNVSNWADVQGGVDLKFLVTYEYNPVILKGGYLVSGDFGTTSAVYGEKSFLDSKVTIPLQIENESGDGYAFKGEDSAYYEFHSRIVSPSVQKTEADDNRNGIFFKWQDAWGPNPDATGDAAGNYFYVIWYAKIRRCTSGGTSQSFSMRVEDLDGTGVGELVGCIGTVGTGSEKGCNFTWCPDGYPVPNKSYAGIAAEGWQDRLTFRAYTDNVDGEYHLRCYTESTKRTVCLLMRYPMSLFDGMSADDQVNVGVKLENTVKVTSIGDDSQTVNGVEYGTKSATSTTTINVRKNKGGGGGLSVAKSRYSGNVIKVGGGQDAVLAVDEGAEVPIKPSFAYTINAIGSPFDINPDSETGSSVNPYTISIQDNEMYLTTLSSSSTTQWPRVWSGESGMEAEKYDAMKLEKGDYQFTCFTISIAEYGATYEGGGWAIDTAASKDYSSMLETTVYCDGTKYGTIKQDSSGKYVLTKVNGDTQTITDKNPAVLPEGTSDVRFDHQASCYQCTMTVNLGVSLLASALVKEKVQKDADNKKYTGFTNMAKSFLNETTAEGEESQAADSKYGDQLHGSTYYLNRYTYYDLLTKNTAGGSFQNDTTKGIQEWTAWIKLDIV